MGGEPYGAKVNIVKMRMTKESHHLFEVKGGDKSLAEVSVQREAVASIAGGDVGTVAQLGGWAEVEILDLDPTVSEGQQQARWTSPACGQRKQVSRLPRSDYRHQRRIYWLSYSP